jgi:hypothetical protein
VGAAFTTKPDAFAGLAREALATITNSGASKLSPRLEANAASEGAPPVPALQTADEFHRRKTAPKAAQENGS